MSRRILLLTVIIIAVVSFLTCCNDRDPQTELLNMSDRSDETFGSGMDSSEVEREVDTIAETEYEIIDNQNTEDLNTSESLDVEETNEASDQNETDCITSEIKTDMETETQDQIADDPEEETESSCYTHRFGEWIVVQQPSCVEEGLKKKSCSDCDEEQTERMEALGHEFSDEWMRDKTHHWYPSICGHTDEIRQKSGHRFTNWETQIEPTCGNAGVKKRICTVCLREELDSIPKTGKHVAFDENDQCKACDCSVEELGLVFDSYMDTYQITGYSEQFPDVWIPSQYRGRAVTQIAANAFMGYDMMESITIPSSIQRIGEDAFKDCTSLQKLHIQDIAAWCSIEFKNHLSNPLYYTRKLYFNGEEVTDLIIPSGVALIGHYAFEYCEGLTSVKIPLSVKKIGNSAFFGCSALQTMTYDGSSFLWSRLNKGNYWNAHTGSYSVKCIDGTISK